MSYFWVVMLSNVIINFSWTVFNIVNGYQSRLRKISCSIDNTCNLLANKSSSVTNIHYFVFRFAMKIHCSRVKPVTWWKDETWNCGHMFYRKRMNTKDNLLIRYVLYMWKFKAQIQTLFCTMILINNYVMSCDLVYRYSCNISSVQTYLVFSNHINSVMVSVLALRAVDCRFEPLSGQTKDFKN
jgi:hypothetical protein